MSETALRSLLARAAILMAVLLIGGTAYYYLGHHKCVGSRSYFLMKRAGQLLYLETHEPIDYAEAANEYAFLLKRIRFDDPDGNYAIQYAKALKRAQIKAKVQRLLEEYDRTSDITGLQDAWSILCSDEAHKNEAYGRFCFYYKHELVDQEWVDERILRHEETGM